MNIEVIERLAKVHAQLVENYHSIGNTNKSYSQYASTTEVAKAAETIAAKISSEVGESI